MLRVIPRPSSYVRPYMHAAGRLKQRFGLHMELPEYVALCQQLADTDPHTLLLAAKGAAAQDTSVLLATQRDNQAGFGGSTAFLVARRSGGQQWAWDGKPLYYFAGDARQGDAAGDGMGGTWHTVRLGEQRSMVRLGQPVTTARAPS